MSKSRKILGALLAVVMVLSVLSISAFAAGATSYEDLENDPLAANYSQTWALGTPSGSDSTYTVDVLLTTNYNVGPVSFKLEGVTSIVEIEVKDGYYKDATLADKANSGLILMVPDTSSTVVSKEASGTIATITYTTNAAGGVVSIANDPKNANNPNGTLVAARATAATINVSDFVVGQPKVTVTGPGATPPAGDADLELKSGVKGIVVDSSKTFAGSYDGVVYGFNQTANNTFKNANYIKNALEATSDVDLVIRASDGGTAATGNYGTGSTITVLNADGSTAKVYAVCIFGDVDGNGLINTADANAVKASVNNTKIPNNSIQRLAANAQNVNNATMMHNIVTGDASAIKAHIGGTKLNMAALAERHNSFNNNYQ